MTSSAQAPTTRRYRGIPLALSGARRSLGRMTDATVLSPSDLEAYIPHRGMNLIPDELTIAADGLTGGATVVVPEGDARGREVFGRDDGAGGRAWQEPFLAEILALVGVSMLHERLAAEGKEGVYSAISRLKCGGLVDLRQPLEAHATITRDRGAFTQFVGGITQNGVELFSGEFMSGSAPLSEVASQPVRPGDGVAGEAPVADFSWKPAALRFIDDVRSADADGGTLVAGYTYPEGHPFVPGHFPDAALMMGVTQWQAVFDAGVEAAARFGLDGDVAVDGSLKRSDGSEIVNVRGLVIGRTGGLPVIRETKRVAFREPVRPGDGMTVEVTAAAV